MNCVFHAEMIYFMAIVLMIVLVRFDRADALSIVVGNRASIIAWGLARTSTRSAAWTACSSTRSGR